MTETQDVLDQRRPRRRRTPVILLGTLPAIIASTILLTEGRMAGAEEASAPVNSAAAAVVETATTKTPGVVAPSAIVDTSLDVQQIKVTYPPKPKPKPVTTVTTKRTTTTSTSTSTKTTSTTKTTTAKKTSTTTSYKSYCASPKKPVYAGSSAKSLLAATNKERAHIGARSLSWSSSLASAAQKWSNTMLAKDLKTDKLIDGLSHNPNRPGAENVAVVYNSAGYSASNAISRMHRNWVYSYGHCLNLMNPAYSTMGAGVAHSSDGTTWYATENFR